MSITKEKILSDAMKLYIQSAANTQRKQSLS